MSSAAVIKDVKDGYGKLKAKLTSVTVLPDDIKKVQKAKNAEDFGVGENAVNAARGLFNAANAYMPVAEEKDKATARLVYGYALLIYAKAATTKVKINGAPAKPVKSKKYECTISWQIDGNNFNVNGPKVTLSGEDLELIAAFNKQIDDCGVFSKLTEGQLDALAALLGKIGYDFNKP